MTANTLEKERQRGGVIRNRDVVPGGKVKGVLRRSSLRRKEQPDDDSSSARLCYNQQQ